MIKVPRVPLKIRLWFGLDEYLITHHRKLWRWGKVRYYRIKLSLMRIICHIRGHKKSIGYGCPGFIPIIVCGRCGYILSKAEKDKYERIRNPKD